MPIDTFCGRSSLTSQAETCSARRIVVAEHQQIADLCLEPLLRGDEPTLRGQKENIRLHRHRQATGFLAGPSGPIATTAERYCVVVSDKILVGAVTKCLRSPFQPSMTTIA